MSINPVSTRLPSTILQEGISSKQSQGDSAASGFHSLLASLGGGTASRAQIAAADILRIEMMQHSLALFGDDATDVQSSPSSGVESLLAALVEDPRGASPRPPLPSANGAESELLTELTGGAAASQESVPSLDQIGKTAAQYLGTPYRFGGEGANGIDCSSFIQHVFREQGIELPRTAREQSKVGSEVEPGDLRKGDLVFFHTYASYPSHVGIYLGDGKMIHASSVKGEVTISDMNTDYYRSRYLGAKRIA